MRRIKPFFGMAINLSLCVFLVACWATRVSRWDEAGTGQQRDPELAKQLEASGDEHFKKRFQQVELEKALAKWQEAADAFPSARINTKLSRGYFFLADAFYGLADKEELRDENYTKGLGYAEKALQFSAPTMVAKVKDGSKWSDAVASAPIEAIDGLYWYAVNLGKWAASKGFVTKLRYKDDIKNTMVRVQELNPDYYYGASQRYFGAFEAATSGLAGGSLEKSYENFERSNQMAPEYLATKVLWAEYWAIKKQDKKKFEELLKDVLAADPTKNPLLEPENRKEQEKAKKLLAAMDEHF